MSAAVAILASLALAGAPAGTSAAGGAPTAYEAAVHLSGKIGSRPAGGRGERRAHSYAADRFRAAGLTVTTPSFGVPGRGRSRNVIGALDTPRDCLTILMAHTDSVPPGLGANDNASGVGVLIGLAPKLAGLDPTCDVWLVATGAEERVVIGTGYHVGAAELVKTVKSQGRGGDLRFALSVDMVGRGKRFYLRSPQPSTRPGVEGEVLAASGPRRCHDPLGARLRRRQLRPPRVRARRPARRGDRGLARRGPLPPRGLRPAGAPTEGRGQPRPARPRRARLGRLTGGAACAGDAGRSFAAWRRSCAGGRRLAALATGAALTIAGGLAGGSSADPIATAAAPVKVSADDNFFSPVKAKVAVGGKVKWTNTGKADHNVTFGGNSGSGNFGPGEIVRPEVQAGRQVPLHLHPPRGHEREGQGPRRLEAHSPSIRRIVAATPLASSITCR